MARHTRYPHRQRSRLHARSLPGRALAVMITGRPSKVRKSSGGAAPNYHIQVVDVTLNQIHVVRGLDGGLGNDGEYRAFVNVGNDWLFLNDIASQRTPFGVSRPDNILEGGLATLVMTLPLIWATLFRLTYRLQRRPMVRRRPSIFRQEAGSLTRLTTHSVTSSIPTRPVRNHSRPSWPTPYSASGAT